jgi:acetolactate decarboxylase
VKKTFLLLILLAFGACTTKPVVQVSRIGELEDMIKKGDLSTKANLADFSNSPPLYAIGSITNMKGHIQIIDGKPYNCYLENGSLKIDSSFNLGATFMLYANVEEWKEHDLPAGITTWKQLEQFIGDLYTLHFYY